MTGKIQSSKPPGSIIAFEGHAETISTQLRLLPTSSQILVLPDVQCYLPEDGSCGKFDAPTFIRQVHEAAVARNEAAQTFLQHPASNGKRLVFLSGGTPSAQALCMREIMKHETDGNDSKAEDKFNFLVREGLAGLGVQRRKWEAQEASARSPRATETDQLGKNDRNWKALSLKTVQDQPEQIDEDPITRAMRAAEALDRQTASLQPSNELDLTLSTRPRSTSMPMYGYSDSYGDAAPFFVFGAPNRRRANSDVSVEGVADDATLPPLIDMAPKFAVTHYEDFPEQALITTEASYSPSCIGETYGPTFLHSPLADGLATSKSEAFELRSPAEVVFGEAALVDVRNPSGKGPVLRVRSLDRIYPSSPKLLRLSQTFGTDAEDANAPLRPQSCMVMIPSKKDLSSSRLDPVERPRTVLVKAKQLGHVTLAPAPMGKKRHPTYATYIDRGTDAEVRMDDAEPFTPVLPLVEDFAVYFREDVTDALLDRVIKGFKDGIYPVPCPSTDGSEADTVTDHLPSTPKSQNTCHDEDKTPQAEVSDGSTVVASSMDGDDYDPFAYVQSSWPPKSKIPRKPVPGQPTAKMEAPPTPEKTPEPSVSGKEERFHEFPVASNQTAVTIQNSLRSVLNAYFPPEAEGYNQFQFSFLPELEGLWKPIFREAEPGSPRTSNHRMDQILAIGSQQGVKREFSSRIIGLLSRLGFKNSGISRSGRLDFRYLLANAMQAFTAQPLTNQASGNPFDNPYLLATLIVPHLETYLALHSEVRYLLLEYPPEHLPTVLALQKLVGVDLMKVVQIVDAKSGDLGAFRHMRGASITNGVEKSSSLGKPVCLDATVSKANFLLTSSANESDITTFTATVRKILTSVSDYYVPEKPMPSTTPIPVPEAPAPNPPPKAKPPLLTSRFSTIPKAGVLQSPTMPVAMGSSPSPVPSRAPSIAETVRTFKSARTGRSRKSRRRPPTADGGESIMTYDPAEDSDYDFEERRLMPIFMQKSSRRPKPNSRKALKFLGLA